MMNLHRVKSLKVKSVAFLTTALVLTAVGPANAGLFDPAYRGDDNSVHAIFEWVDQGVPWDLTTFGATSQDYNLHATAPSASDNGVDTTIMLPNFIDPLEMKYLRIQMDFDLQVEGSLIAMDVVGHDPLGAAAIEVNRSIGLASSHFVDWEIQPNPDWEEIFIFGNTGAFIFPGNLQVVEIDTVSFGIPEPGTLAHAALGLLGMSYRRKRT